MSDFAIARQKMVDGQIRPSDVTDLRIIDAMLMVPRETFVPESMSALSYLDLNLDLGGAGADRRFLIKPAVLAKMLQAAEIRETDDVLVVGTATDYAVAVVSTFAGQVRAIRSHSALAANPGPIDATDGQPRADQSCDVVILDGATEVVPVELYKRLRNGGRLVGVFATGYPQRAMLVAHSHADFGTRPLFDAAVPVLPGLEQLSAFVF